MDDAQFRQVQRLLLDVAQDSVLLRRWYQRDGSRLLRDLEQLTARDDEPEEPQSPGLFVSRAEAANQLRERIDLGRTLLNGSMRTRWQLGQSWVAYDEWSQGNVRLLKSLFRTNTEAEFYNLPRATSAPGSTTPDDARALRDGLAEMIDRLEQVLEQLERGAAL